MSDPVGFVTMGTAPTVGAIPEIGVGMLGHAFMGKAHANAYKTLAYMMYPPPALPRLLALCGRSREAVEAAARRYGFARASTDWRDLVADARIALFDNGAPNDLHAEPCMAAAAAGKHVLCEKPLGRTATEARAMRDAVRQAGIKHMVAFNYRFVPAIRQARDLIAAGALGKIYHFRALYLQEWISDPQFPLVWRLRRDIAGSGAVGDIGSHIVDLARFLVGEPVGVMATTRTFVSERPLPAGGGTGRVDVDDAFAAVVEFAGGAIGTLEASRFCPGRKNHQVLEVNGARGSLRFDLERLNELEVYWTGQEPKETRGFSRVQISETYHPYWAHWWPHGHNIGWEHTFVHEIYHFLNAIVNDAAVEPDGATFEDGYRAAVVCDAILESARTGRRVAVQY